MYFVPKQNPRHLVRAYITGDGKHRQEKLHYVYMWPTAERMKLKQLYEDYYKEKSKTERDDSTKAFKQKAAEKAARILYKIERLKSRVRIQVFFRRQSVDRRINLTLPPRLEDRVKPLYNPYMAIREWLIKINWHDLEHHIKDFSANPSFGDLRTLKARRPDLHLELKHKFGDIRDKVNQVLTKLGD